MQPAAGHGSSLNSHSFWTFLSELQRATLNTLSQHPLSGLISAMPLPSKLHYAGAPDFVVWEWQGFTCTVWMMR